MHGGAGAVRRSRGGLGSLALLACIACEPGARQSAAAVHDGAATTNAPQVSDAAKPTSEAKATAPDTRPTLGRVLGLPADVSLPLWGSNKLALDTVVTLPTGASIELNYAGGASVRVVGPARIAVPDGPAGLLLQQGTATVDLELSARHPGSGFWLATPCVRLELVQGARFVVRAFADRSSELTAVSGVLGMVALGKEDEPSARLVAGTRARIREDGHAEIGPITEPSPKSGAPAHLQTEEARLVGLSERAVSKGPGASTAQSVRAAGGGGQEPSSEDGGSGREQRVEAACEAVVTSLKREAELQARHRALVAQHDSQAMELQRELAQQGAQTFAARRLLGKRLSLLEADGLSHGASGRASPLIARARELLR